VIASWKRLLCYDFAGVFDRLRITRRQPGGYRRGNASAVARASGPSIYSALGRRARDFHRRRIVMAEPPIHAASGRATEQRRKPEQPQLLQRPAADEQRRSSAARGIHRRIRNGDADQVDQREAQPDRDWREALRRIAVGCAHDYEQEYERHDEFAHQAGRERIPTR